MKNDDVAHILEGVKEITASGMKHLRDEMLHHIDDVKKELLDQFSHLPNKDEFYGKMEEVVTEL